MSADRPRRRVSRPLARALFTLLVVITAYRSDAATLAPPRMRLGARLRAAGHAECAFVRVSTDAFSGRRQQTRGRLALETPDRSRLEFLSTGERITLRGDGGEWLQPRLRQLIVFGPARASGARRWWQLLIDGSAPGIEASARGAREISLRASGGAGPDSARLELDGAGLPSRLVVPDGGDNVEYRFARWSFGPAQGVSAFRQRAPSEYERVELP